MRELAASPYWVPEVTRYRYGHIAINRIRVLIVYRGMDVKRFYVIYSCDALKRFNGY